MPRKILFPCVALIVAGLLALLTSREDRETAPRRPPASPPAEAAAPAVIGEAPAVVAGEAKPRASRPTGRLRVRVLELTPRRPAAGVRVVVTPTDGAPLEALTIEDGTVFFPEVPAGPATATAEAPGFWPAYPGWSDVPPGGLATTELVLERPVAISGTVVRAEDGGPVPDARVRLFKALLCALDGTQIEDLKRPLGEAITGPDGGFSATSLSPRCNQGILFVVSAEGCRTTIWRGRDGIRIRLAPGAALRGRVADREGRPIPGARVIATLAGYPFTGSDVERVLICGPTEAEGYAPLETATDMDGQFEFAGLGRGERYTLWIVAKGYATARREKLPVPSPPIEVVLDPGANLVVTVLDRDGRPVPRASVRIEGKEATAFIDDVTTGDDGRACFRDLPPGTIDIRSWALPDRKGSARAEVPAAGEAAVEVRLDGDFPGRPYSASLPTGNETIEGTVAFTDGAAVDRGVVRIPSLRRWTAIEEGGSFRIEGLPAGEFEVTVEARRSPGGRVTAAVPGPPVRLSIARAPALRGRLVWPADVAQPAKLETHVTPPGTLHRLGPIADGQSDCPFDFEVPSGEVHVVFTVSGCLPFTFDGSVPAGGALDLGDVMLSAGRIVSGRVLDEEGTPVAGAEVGTTTRGFTLCDARGTYRLTGLEPGALTLIARAEGFLEAAVTVAEGGEAADVVLSRGVLVEVLIENADGDPVARADILLARELGERLCFYFEATTGSDGRADLRLAPGEYKLTVSAPEPRHVSSLSLDAAAVERVVIVIR